MDLKKLHKQWVRSLTKCIESDSWGQVVEAVEEYEKLAVQLSQSIQDWEELQKHKETISDICTVLNLRAEGLTALADNDGPTVEDMTRILDVLKSLFCASVVFPVDLNRRINRGRDQLQGTSALVLDSEINESGVPNLKQGIQPSENCSYLLVHIEKVGLKDSNSYIDPCIAVSVFDGRSNQVEEKQETETSKTRSPPYLGFNTDIHIQTSFEKIVKDDCSIIFEFIHYKPKKKKKSCRCWALLEKDEIVNGKIALELYKKPADPKKKRISLFSIKPLYLHLQLKIRSA